MKNISQPTNKKKFKITANHSPPISGPINMDKLNIIKLSIILMLNAIKLHTNMPYLSLMRDIIILPHISLINMLRVYHPNSDGVNPYTSSIQNEVVVIKKDPLAMPQKKILSKIKTIFRLKTVLRSPTFAAIDAVDMVDGISLNASLSAVNDSLSNENPKLIMKQYKIKIIPKTMKGKYQFTNWII